MSVVTLVLLCGTCFAEDTQQIVSDANAVLSNYRDIEDMSATGISYNDFESYLRKATLSKNRFQRQYKDTPETETIKKSMDDTDYLYRRIETAWKDKIFSRSPTTVILDNWLTVFPRLKNLTPKSREYGCGVYDADSVVGILLGYQQEYNNKIEENIKKLKERAN
jgi:hypothetical protein